ncbi:MAG: hypothetical protein AAGI48_04155 [Verrucomicrobiota bacterium]
MGLIIYRCADDFPERIPRILSRLDPPVVCEGGAEPESEFDSYYRYEIRRGLGHISVSGSRDDDFMSVVPVYGSLNPIRSSASSKLLEETLSVLVSEGMREVTAEELLDYEARRNNLEAEAGHDA